jgi:hypothetical protein
MNKLLQNIDWWGQKLHVQTPLIHLFKLKTVTVNNIQAVLWISMNIQSGTRVFTKGSNIIWVCIKHKQLETITDVQWELYPIQKNKDS